MVSIEHSYGIPLLNQINGERDKLCLTNATCIFIPSS